MTQEGASVDHETTGGLRVDLQRARSEAEKREVEARVGENVQDTKYWNGRRTGLEFAIMKLSESGWGPPDADACPDEVFVLSVELSVNRKTGVVTSLMGGKWDEHDEFDDAFDLISEVACEIVNRNPEEYVTEPAPRTVRLRQASVPAMDRIGEPLMLSASEAVGSNFVYDDGQIVTLILPDGQTVRVGKVDVDVEQIAP